MKAILICYLSLFLFSTCIKEKQKTIFLIKNTLNLERSFETVELTSGFLKITNLDLVGIKDVKSGELQISQMVDNDGDGQVDVLLFQPQIGANSSRAYEIVSLSENENLEAMEYCYSRFVPERIDDYAWENNKVAFRAFGPTAEKMKENNISGGTLTSGIDAWLKRVEYPIINKWYKETIDGTGDYHKDTGEGLDNFHVGISRGVGGVAVKKDSIFYFSKNFTKWRTICNGPIRTSFYLEYELWDAGGQLIKESKIISLDYGNNLSKYETFISGSNTISAGLTLHEKDGVVKGDNVNGWVSYWEPHGVSELGTAIIASSYYFQDFENFESEINELNNAYLHLNVKNKKVVYYAGFGWKKRGQFKNNQDWEIYLNNFAKKINTPLKVELVL